MEVEYKSLADVAAEVTWINDVLADLGEASVIIPTIWCDNSGAIAMSANPVYHTQSKHVDLDMHFVREKVVAKQLQVQYVPASHQIADGFTKPLARGAFEYFRDRVKVHLVQNKEKAKGMLSIDAVGNNTRAKIADMATPSGDWRWQLFEQLLPHDILLRIAALKGPSNMMNQDCVGWRCNNDLSFTVKSAYAVRHDIPDWIACNLQGDSSFAKNPSNWHLMFAVTLWHIWRARNAKFIGICSIIDAELWGAFVGLNFAWNAGFRQVILELDSIETLRILKLDYNGTHTLGWYLNELRRRNWCVQIQHVLHNGNKVADTLAKFASLIILDPILIDFPPTSITKLLLEDMLVLDSVYYPFNYI
ncbi:hypothetical protein F3Y22_tig00117056pilonHSYRG00889 [Hibiscus syriacus]|uniref:RNase H type-1 domain-containing protein n=1 Tax=Hibiscus syriacus TaxID=106335 RepID=A0A6A2XJX0_HIBSY|nr:hypothetical protein F3Y22_tig00117056pilonHSYRG00889 [Hibiscus syriacus]